MLGKEAELLFHDTGPLRYTTNDTDVKYDERRPCRLVLVYQEIVGTTTIDARTYTILKGQSSKRYLMRMPPSDPTVPGWWLLPLAEVWRFDKPYELDGESLQHYFEPVLFIGRIRAPGPAVRGEAKRPQSYIQTYPSINAQAIEGGSLCNCPYIAFHDCAARI